jgi:hypothetical protein
MLELRWTAFEDRSASMLLISGLLYGSGDEDQGARQCIIREDLAIHKAMNIPCSNDGRYAAIFLVSMTISIQV